MAGEPTQLNLVCLLVAVAVTVVYFVNFDIFPEDYWSFRPNNVLQIKTDWEAVVVYFTVFLLVIVSEWQSMRMRQWRILVVNPNIPYEQVASGGRDIAVHLAEQLDVGFRALAWTLFTLLAVSSGIFLVLTVIGRCAARGVMVQMIIEEREMGARKKGARMVT